MAGKLTSGPVRARDPRASCKLLRAKYPAPPDGKPYEFTIDIRFHPER